MLAAYNCSDLNRNFHRNFIFMKSELRRNNETIQSFWLFFGGGARVWLWRVRPGRAWGTPPQSGKLLYMTLCKGYHHDSVELSEQILKEIGEKSGAFQVTVTQDVGAFTKENLKNYSAVMFYTTGELPFTDEEKSALVDFLKSGHGFVGVHSATDTLYEWGAYNKIIGGYFNDHPWHQLVTVDVVDPNSKLVSSLGKSFQITDEIYQIADFQADTSHVLLALDPSSVDLNKPAGASALLRMADLPGRGCSAKGASITTVWGTKRRFGMIPATRTCS